MRIVVGIEQCSVIHSLQSVGERRDVPTIVTLWKMKMTLCCLTRTTISTILEVHFEAIFLSRGGSTLGLPVIDRFLDVNEKEGQQKCREEGLCALQASPQLRRNFKGLGGGGGREKVLRLSWSCSAYTTVSRGELSVGERAFALAAAQVSSYAF